MFACAYMWTYHREFSSMIFIWQQLFVVVVVVLVCVRARVFVFKYRWQNPAVYQLELPPPPRLHRKCLKPTQDRPHYIYKYMPVMLSNNDNYLYCFIAICLKTVEVWPLMSFHINSRTRPTDWTKTHERNMSRLLTPDVDHMHLV